jgi:nicotinate-nucleotide adenylyltransferase
MTAAAAPARVGILGGTLDPIHLGHLDAAVAARDALDLTDVRIMPARVPPHRHQGPAASMFHRFALAALAVNDLERLTASDMELCADGPSYTALTLERLAARGLQPAQIFFITGADAFAEIETWYRYPEVLDLAHFVVIARPGSPVATVADRLPALGGRIVHGAPRAALDVPSVILIDAQTADVSSTAIRRRLRSGETIAGLVPPSVERHILNHRLYAEPSTADQMR